MKYSTLTCIILLLTTSLFAEEPIEFIHPFKASLVNQREVGKHSLSYPACLRAALREDPDVIVIGELRDKETTSLALNAAETGHIVLTTLNAKTTAKAIDRVISAFPPDDRPQVRESFAGSLKLCIAQTLVKKADNTGLTGCFEILKGTFSVSSLIRDDKTFQIPSALQIGQHAGMRTFDMALMQMVRGGIITPETAYARATQKETFEPLVSAKFLEEIHA